MNPFRNRLLWSWAEYHEYVGNQPRWFWRWLLKRCDRAHGYNFEYDR